MAENNFAWGSLALLVVGLLILVPSGLCTGVFAFGDGGYGLWGVALVIGGPFVIGGALMVWAGIKGLRRPKNPPDLTSFD